LVTAVGAGEAEGEAEEAGAVVEEVVVGEVSAEEVAGHPWAGVVAEEVVVVAEEVCRSAGA
jgi:hypothetical protein